MRFPESRRLGDGSFLRYWLSRDGYVYGCITSKRGRHGRTFRYMGDQHEGTQTTQQATGLRPQGGTDEGPHQVPTQGEAS